MKSWNYPADKKKIMELIDGRTFEINREIEDRVFKIIEDVRSQGDQALFKYTRKFDGVNLDNLKVDSERIEKACGEVEGGYLSSLNKAIDNIEQFHQKQKRESWFAQEMNSINGQLVNPLQRIGVYVPGGRAAYPSSVLMTVIPALVAGVEEVVAVTPPDSDGNINPYTLAALNTLGVNEVYAIGGSQAIAALAFGTETISAVDKIVGPGNIYVTLAKKLVYGYVDIDMLAGPSEILIVADQTANPAFVAADLLAQAEHDPGAISVLIASDKKLIEMVKNEINRQLDQLERRDIASQALKDNGAIIEVKDLVHGLNLANQFAPEHLELLIDDPFAYLGQIKNAGAVFLGDYTPEALGDYMAGPNHVLPTGGTATFSSPLSVDEFYKKTSILYSNSQSLKQKQASIDCLAQLEGLTGHANAVNIRFKEN